MFKPTITKHAQERMSQRAIGTKDLLLILAIGKKVRWDKLMLTKRQAAREIEKLNREMVQLARIFEPNEASRKHQNLKRRISQIGRLAGVALVIVDGELITVYRQTKSLR